MVDEGAGSDSNKQTWFVKLHAVNLLENLGNKKVKKIEPLKVKQLVWINSSSLKAKACFQ